jgi:uncharacterized Zn-binding protein involved in type VI secretion
MPPAARQTDTVAGTDTHLVSAGPSQTLTPFVFATSTWTGGLSADVLVDGLPAAVAGSQISIVPPHGPASFVTPPLNRGVVASGSSIVLINGKPAARQGDPVTTCNDGPPTVPARIATGSGTVIIG